MELDLDSFLDSHLSSDSDDESNSYPHRTVDEILNDSDSGSSASSFSSRSIPLINQFHHHHNNSSNRIGRSSSVPPESTQSVIANEAESIKPSQLESRSGATARVGDPIWRVSSSSSVRQLPTLFGGVRSNAKPGAALAAAAAASRSIPTPYAAALKSRRAGSGALQKVVDSGEIGSNVRDDNEVSSSHGDSIGVDLELSGSGEKPGSCYYNVGDSQSAFADISINWQSKKDESDEIVHSKDKEVEEEESNVADGGDSHLLNTNTLLSNSYIEPADGSCTSVIEENLDHNRPISVSDEAVDEKVGFVSMDENSTFLDLNDPDKKSVSSLLGFDQDGKFEEDLAIVLSEKEDADNGLPGSKDSEVEGVGGSDASSISDISELVEERLGQLRTERISKKAEKHLRASMKPLELAEELEKKQASTGLHWEEGAAAQPMRLEGVKRGSTTLGYFDINAENNVSRTISSHAFRRDHGSPQVLTVHLNYIAVGMTRGVIVLVPSKYSAHHADNMDGKMVMLGLQGERSYSPVTSMCFNQPGDLLLAGYGDGHITVWDVQKASAVKVITGEHNAPVVHALFLGQDSLVTRQFKAVTGDSKGLVLLHASSVVPLLNRFSIKTQCLLDGQKTGTVLSASPLLFDDASGGTSVTSQGNAAGSSSIGSMMGGVVVGDAGWKLFNEGSSLAEEGVVIFVTYQTALVVRLTPTLEVYAQLSRPEGVREGSIPYTAWKCVTQSRGSTENSSAGAADRVSLLALAWDRKVQVAKLVKSELKVYGSWSLDSAAIGVAWLDDQMLVVLTITGQLYLFAKDGTIIHQTSFALDGSVGDDLVVYHTQFINVFGNPEKAYHNCIAVRGASVYVLGPVHLVVSRLLPWKERIQVLRKAGDWMGALNMAMTLYDGQAHGVIDLPRDLLAVQELIMPYLVELLLSYVDEVFSYISVAFCNQMGKMEGPEDSNSRSSSVQFEIKEQFTRVGGVAVEFCVHIKRTDILFDEIFSKFIAVQHRDTFLELLEPYILKDMLGSLPPEIMQVLVEHYSSKGWLQRVEQCVLHMDISSLDFNQVVRLCREHGLYGALIYLFNKGLDDFRAPLEELLVVLRNSQRESASAVGYRMLVYLKYCFSGLAFPPGQGTLPPSRLPSLRTELLQFLLEVSDGQNPKPVSNLSFGGSFLNLYHLLELDTEATLDVLRCAFIEDETHKADSSFLESADANADVKRENDLRTESQNMLIQSTIEALVHVLNKNVTGTDGTASIDQAESIKAWPSYKDMGYMFEFIAFYVACERANVSRNVLNQILEYLTSENNGPESSISTTGTSKRREKQLLALLEVVPETDWNPSRVLQLCESACFYQVCGLIHATRQQYIAALDSYMKDVDEPVCAFSFINKTLLQLSGTEYAAFRSAIIERIPGLVNLSREGTFLLVVDHFSEEDSHILSELRSHPKSLFLYLKTVIEVHLSGTLNFSYLRKDEIVDVSGGGRMKDKSKELEAYFERISGFPKFLRSNPLHVTDDMIELYLELLCQFERDSVLKFLETFDSYRVEHCLRLCQEYGVIDAAAYLLERVGDVGSALLLTLSGLTDKFRELETAVESIVSNVSLSKSASMEHLNTVSKMKEVSDIYDILHACIGLCQRNTPRLNPEESETLWFRLLDSFCGPLMGAYSDEKKSQRENHAGLLIESSDSQEEETCTIKWRISKSHKGAHILRKLCSQFIKEIVEGMIGYVRLPTIMSKLLSDNGNQEFGDFKLTILGMLGTYGFERRILDTAKSLIEDDTFYTMSVLKKGASHGYAPRSLLCCICNSLLFKNSSIQIRIFSCGHATHLQCEQENEASTRGSSSGCPICVPKKNTQRSRNKSAFIENGLVTKYPLKHLPPQGMTLYSHESDALENSYGFQQISRFELLTNLQKDQKLSQVENLPPLRLAPPAVYHEKVKKGSDLLAGESSDHHAAMEKPGKNRQFREVKGKGSSLRFPLKPSIFGKEKPNKQ